MTEAAPRAGWRFVDATGTFILDDADQDQTLYFPLANGAGLLSAVTPMLHGDIKTDQHHFLTAPVSVEDLHNSRSARNFWLCVDGTTAWSAVGNSAAQNARRFAGDPVEHVTVEAGFLWHAVTRDAPALGLRARIVSFVPAGPDRVEIMRVTITNTGDCARTLSATAAIPLYARSADNLRDHRHVTSLLHRITTHPYGVSVCPTLSFDERGHQPNRTRYAVLGTGDAGAAPAGFYPTIEGFIGSGALDWPEAVVRSLPPSHGAGQALQGAEALGGLRFRETVLPPGGATTYVIVLAILEADDDLNALVQAYGSTAQCEAWLARTRAHWQAQLATPAFRTGDERFNLWMKWVTLQPILRRMYGCSFLPHHDYGHGGRGWRDLWQDCLALLIMQPAEVSALLWHNFAGVRLDGSNATIIGNAPGEFRADRNDIARVWMDHGAWPLLTTRLYIDQSGDLAFLLKEQTYFKDQHSHRAQAVDRAWRPDQGTQQRTSPGTVYTGSVLEHLLVQHLTAFFNAGAHGNLRLENADWNDALDMAAGHGESVAFSALYAGNLLALSRLVHALGNLGLREVELAVEVTRLLDTLGGRVDYASPGARQQRLHEYCDACEHAVSGRKVAISLNDLARDLAVKGTWLRDRIREHEWVQNEAGFAWFNGYYDDQGRRVEGDHPAGVRMTLTGQVFTLMCGVATDEQAREIARAAEHYLYDAKAGGYRLNTDFKEVALDLGRCFGFAYGHKENGAMFSHMAVMYASALYQRGLVATGAQALLGLYEHLQDFATSRIYPGIPEYVDPQGRGMYHYLTGSASWLLLTCLTEVFGIKGRLGDLVLAPRLVAGQFDAAGDAGVTTRFADRRLEIVFHNPARRDHGAYRIASVTLDGAAVACASGGAEVVLPRAMVTKLEDATAHRIEVLLE